MRLRVILLTAIATLFVAVLAWAVEPYNTSARWSCFVGTCVVGHADADAIAITTDGGVVTMDGEISVAPTDGLDLGWTIVAGANTACNTTCTTACVLGFELGAWDATSLLACTDATADTCLCAGAN